MMMEDFPKKSMVLFVVMAVAVAVVMRVMVMTRRRLIELSLAKALCILWQ